MGTRALVQDMGWLAADGRFEEWPGEECEEWPGTEAWPGEEWFEADAWQTAADHGEKQEWFEAENAWQTAGEIPEQEWFEAVNAWPAAEHGEQQERFEATSAWQTAGENFENQEWFEAVNAWQTPCGADPDAAALACIADADAAGPRCPVQEARCPVQEALPCQREWPEASHARHAMPDPWGLGAGGMQSIGRLLLRCPPLPARAQTVTSDANVAASLGGRRWAAGWRFTQRSSAVA